MIMAEANFASLRQQAGMSIDDLSAQLGFSSRTLYRWERGDTKPRAAAINLLSKLVEQKSPRIEDTRFKFIDLFAGIGGLRKGFESIGGECVFTSEWNKFCLQTYKANFKSDHEIVGDITAVSAREIPEHDLLLAGFPCQPFSIAGVSKKNSLNVPHGFRCETQGTLFFDIARILGYCRPKAFLLENVKNLVSHDKGKTFKVIQDTLVNELGYDISYRVIDAKSWTPQHRERIFIVGFREDCNFSLDNMSILDSSFGPKLLTILHSEDGTESPSQNPGYIDEQSGNVDKKYTLSDKLWIYLQRYAAKHRKKGNGFGYGLVGPNDTTRTLSARYYKDGSEILLKQRGKNPRRLTPRECSRLMGFDKSGKSEFVIPVSDAQAYRQFGNAAVVPVVEVIARFMESRLVSENYASIQHIYQPEMFVNG